MPRFIITPIRRDADTLYADAFFHAYFFAILMPRYWRYALPLFHHYASFISPRFAAIAITRIL